MHGGAVVIERLVYLAGACVALLVLTVGYDVEPIRAAVVAMLWPVVPLVLAVVAATGVAP